MITLDESDSILTQSPSHAPAPRWARCPYRAEPQDLGYPSGEWAIPSGRRSDNEPRQAHPANPSETLPSESASAWVKRRLAGSPALTGIAQVGGVTKANAIRRTAEEIALCQGVLCPASSGTGMRESVKRLRNKRKKQVDLAQIRYAPYHLRKRVYERDVGQCQYCGTTESFEACVIDHVYPHHRGVKTRADNLVVACRLCNDLKSGQILPPGFGPRDWFQGELRAQASRRMKDTMSVIQEASAMGIYLDDLFSEAAQEQWK